MQNNNANNGMDIGNNAINALNGNNANNALNAINGINANNAMNGINGNDMDIGGGELDNGMNDIPDDFVINPQTGLTMGQLRYQRNYEQNTQRNLAILANNNNGQRGGRRTKKRKSIKRKRSLKKRKSYKKNKKSRR